MIWRYLADKFPKLRHQMRVAHMPEQPNEFMRRIVVRTSMYTILLGVLLAMLVDKMGWSIFIALLGTIIIFLFGFWFAIKKPVLIARKRAIDIDREVLFAGRFILIKLHSGKPLIEALSEAAESYGVANKYFSEIVRDIELGTPLETAIEHAMTYTSSDSFRKVLFQIHNALKLGIDVTKSLEAVLEEITGDQLLAIERYGKKLSGITLFYMLVAIVFPSLGMTIMTVIISFTNINMKMSSFLVVIFFLFIINFTFITVFKGIRPKVNI